MLNLNKYIDHTLLKPDASAKQITMLCNEAVKYEFKSVCVNPYRVSQAYKILRDTSVIVCTVIAFPLGATATNIKCLEANQAIDDGAKEIDMVINIGSIKDGDWDYVKNDIKGVIDTVSKRAIIKVILETVLLTSIEIEKACKICFEVGADFVKTSTGFSSGGAKVEDVKLMRETVGKSMGVKASGGIKDYETAMKMINAGANRIGTSSGVSIMDSINKGENQNG